MHRTHLRASALALALVGLAGPAGAATGRGTDAPSPVGGPELGSHGLLLHPGPSTPPLPPELIVPSWLVADLDTGQVLAAKDPHGRYRPASTLKVLTALALLPGVPADTTITPTRAMANIEGTRVGVEADKSYSRSQILQGMMLSSGNDAAEAFAAAYPGGRVAALARMNAVARQLQAVDTYAANPTGLDATGQLSSAYDLALLSRALLQQPELAGVVRQRSTQFPCSRGPSCRNGTFQIQNHNRVVNSIKGAIGVKSGGTSGAQLVVVGAAEQNGHRLVAVVMHAQSIPFTQDVKLLEWGFKALGTLTPVGSLADAVNETAAAGPPGPAAPAAPAPSADRATRPAHGGSLAGGTWTWLGVALLLLAGPATWWRRRRGRAQSARPPGSPTITFARGSAASTAVEVPFDVLAVPEAMPSVRAMPAGSTGSGITGSGGTVAVHTAANTVSLETRTSHTNSPTTTAKEP
jgi:D-alanyl-D-alanine carboxypeptidase (penicillin-binding protein 5/6)